MQIEKILLVTLLLLQINSLLACDVVGFYVVQSIVHMQDVPMYELYGYVVHGFTNESFRFYGESVCVSLASEMNQWYGSYSYTWDTSKYNRMRGDCIICNITSINATHEKTLMSSTLSSTSLSSTSQTLVTNTATTRTFTKTILSNHSSSFDASNLSSTDLTTQISPVTKTSTTFTSTQNVTTRVNLYETITAEKKTSNIPIIVGMLAVCVLMVVGVVLLCKNKTHGEIIFDTAEYETPVKNDRITQNPQYSSVNELDYSDTQIYATLDTNITGAYDNISKNENGIVINDTGIVFTVNETYGK